MFLTGFNLIFKQRSPLWSSTMETEDIPEYDVRSERVGRVRILFS